MFETKIGISLVCPAKPRANVPLSAVPIFAPIIRDTGRSLLSRHPLNWIPGSSRDERHALP